MAPDGDIVVAFRAFLDRATAVAPELATASSVAQFEQFLVRAHAAAAGPLRETALALVPQVTLMRAWATEHDLLAVARRRYDEDAYTELIAWAIRDDTHPESALARQQAWLDVLLADERLELSSPARVTTQIVTDTGVPDLVLELDDFLVVVEAKTGSTEHEAAGSGVAQTLAYPDAVRRALNRTPLDRVLMVFLTPDARRAQNESAIATSYAAFASALAAVLFSYELPTRLSSAYSILFSHFWSLPLPGGARELVLLLDRIDDVLSSRGVTRDDSRLLARLDDVDRIRTICKTGGLP